MKNLGRNQKSVPSSPDVSRKGLSVSRDACSDGGTPLKKRRLFGMLRCVSPLPTIDSVPQHMGAACSSPLTADGIDADSEDEAYVAAAAVRQIAATGVKPGELEPMAGDYEEDGSVDPSRGRQLVTLGSPQILRQRFWSSWRIPFTMKTFRKFKRASSSVDNKSLDWNPVGVGDIVQTLDDGTDENPFVTFRLKVHLKEAHGLVIRDASGSSDPYVKFRYQERTMYKSNTVYRSLNPNWDEEFAFLIDDPTSLLKVEVFDYDRFMMDDSMGCVSVDLSQLKLFDAHDLKLTLEEDKDDGYMGYIQMVVTVTPLTESQRTEFLARATRGVITETAKRTNKAVSVWLSAVNIVLVEAKLNYLHSGSVPDPYVKFKLGSEKCKSKVLQKTHEPKWIEQMDLHIYDENFQTLDVMVRDKNSNTAIGKCSIDLKSYERERTEDKWYQLDDDAGSILLLLTISGTSVSAGTVADLTDFVGNRNDVVNKYGLSRSFAQIKDVGHLSVKVFKAEGLASADINGKSDPFCVLELVNARLQTHTEYKTLNPEWNKLFTFAVKDIHEVLEITVFDEDPNKKVEFLGRVSIPLLKMRNCEKRWYQLKDRKLERRSKGRILLEMDVLWNPVKAAVRTFHPREKKIVTSEPKFKPSMLINSVNRLKNFGNYLISCKEFSDDCLSWRSYPKSISAFLFFITFVYFIQLHHWPMLLLLLFVRFHIYHKVSESIEIRFRGTSVDEDPRLSVESDDDDFSNDSKRPQLKRATTAPPNGIKPGKANDTEKSTGFIDRFQAVQDILQMIQHQLDFVASLLERFRNTFNFTVPYLSYLAIVVLCVAAILLYLVPFRWIIMVWGVNKFSKRLRNPHYVDNNELLDFLSRVPSDKELKLYRELRGNCEEPTPPQKFSVISSSSPKAKVSSSNNKKSK